MESLLAIGVGLVLRVVMDVATDNDDRVGGVLVGLWEGVVLNHFVRRMPRSFDPYLGFGFRIFVDFLFTQSLSRLALVALWALVGMLLADITPNIWRDSGLRQLYRQVCRDVRHVKRAVPRIRVKNDLPSIRLFDRSRSTSSGVSRSIRSDRASPSRSSAPSPAPTPGPPRRQGRCPPGALPDVSGWSETDTSISYQRDHVVMNPGPSPALIPLREHATHGRIDATHVTTSQTRTTAVQDTTITFTQTQNESVVVETVVDATMLATTVAAAASTTQVADDPSRHDPPTIPDDWVDIDHPRPAQSNEPVAPFQPDPPSTPEPQPGLSTLAPSRPPSVLVPPPAMDVLPDIPDVDAGSRISRPADQIPLPESRAASVIGGVYDEPQPRTSLRDSIRSRVDKATSEIGVDSTKSFAPPIATQQTKSQSTSRVWSSLTSSFTRSKLKESIDINASKTSFKDVKEESMGQGKPDVGSVAQGSESQICTPAQVDPPASILSQPKDTTPLLLASVVAEPEQLGQSPASKPDLLSPADDLGVDSTPAPLPSKDEDTAGPRKSKSSLFDVSTVSRTPPPPFTEFAGVPDGPAAGEAPAEQDPLAHDEVPGIPEAPAEQDPPAHEEAPTILTREQSAAEEKRRAFLLVQVQDLERSRVDLREKLEKEDDPADSPAKSIQSDLEDVEKTLTAAKARMKKTKFSESPPNPPIREAILTNKSATEVQFAIASVILEVLLARDDAGPMTILATINRQKPLRGKAKDAKDALGALVRRHKFVMHFDNMTPGIVSITF